MTKHPDLFGGESEIIQPKKKHSWHDAKRMRNYRVSCDPLRACKNCQHHVTKRFSKNYHKCKLLTLSATPSGDITLKSVCDLWEK